MKYAIGLVLMLATMFALSYALGEQYFNNLFIALGGWHFGSISYKLWDKLWTKLSTY